MTGILPVHKPKGISSFDVIRDIKKVLPPELKKEKIGHGGTLDIPAEGVLPILFGEATKAFDFLLNSDKIYRAVIQFGALTDTDDADGKTIQTFDKKTSLEEIKKVLPQFIGKIGQLPPKFSALRVNGVRSYELARNEKEVVLKPRTVNIYDLDPNNFNPETQRLTLTVRCSSGTYIRSLARDIGNALGTGGYILELLRTKSAGIVLEQCHSLPELNSGNLLEKILDLNGALDLPALELKPEREHIINGKPLNDAQFANPPVSDGIYKIIKNGVLLAVTERKEGKMKYLRVFNG